WSLNRCPATDCTNSTTARGTGNGTTGTCQIRAVLSSEAVSTRWLSRLNRADRTGAGCLNSSLNGWPVFASQTRAVMSHEAETTRWPSELNWTDKTASSCFMGTVNGWPVFASQTCALLSKDAVTTRCPSGLNHADRT